MALVFIGLGSNLGDGQVNIKQAWQLLGQERTNLLLALSSPYLTEPVGMAPDSPWFTNAVGAMETKLMPQKLLAAMLAIEQQMGRDRQQGMDRPVDLDILYYDDLLVNEPNLTIPHPDIAKRLFVLAPLIEIAPDHLHPISQLSTTAMQRQLPPTFQVTKSAWVN